MKSFKLSTNKTDFKMQGHSFSMSRTQDGTVQIWSDTQNGIAFATGMAHAHDRQIQMMMVRLIGQGRLSECLMANDELIEIDKFFRRMSLVHEAKKEVPDLDEETRRYLQSYCDGVNHYLAHNWRPFEFKTVGYKPENWCIEDIYVTMKIMSYVGLAQSQGDMEKFIIQAIAENVSLDKLKNLFSPHLDDITDSQIELIKKLCLVDVMVPQELKFLSALPTMKNSNNWVVSGKKTTTGKAICCYDPHLEINRLPAIWYEIVAHSKDNFYMGVTMPGLPGLVMGRNKDISFGFTYGFMDMIDYFIEDVKDGRFNDGGNFRDFNTRTETLKLKKGSPISFKVYENDRGVLEAPAGPLLDGYYLTRAWTNHHKGVAGSPASLRLLQNCTTAMEAREQVKHVTISCNWLLSDVDGNIVYQQSGSAPIRSHSGLHPLEGWKRKENWQGLVDPDDLHHIENPSEGILATANQDLNNPKGPLTINLPMGSYRADRIRELLLEKDKLTVDDMKEIQKDLYSRQAHMYMELVSPLVPDGPGGKILKEWDLNYDRNSKGATLFEAFYSELLELVFGDAFGAKVWRHLAEETSLICDFYHLFDRVLLMEPDNSLWYREKSRKQYLIEALENTFRNIPPGEEKSWGQQNKVLVKNIFFDGKLPKALGFDVGPIPVEGSRATVVQGQIFKAHGRETSFCPGWRFISDLSTFEGFSQLCGGSRDRPYSRYYKNQIDNWLNFKYKKFSAGLN